MVILHHMNQQEFATALMKLEHVDSFSKELNEKWNLISTRLYKEASSDQQGPKAKDAEPVDVEYEDVNK